MKENSVEAFLERDLKKIKESKILILTLKKKIADLSNQQLRINQRLFLHKRNLQLCYFYVFWFISITQFLLPSNGTTIRIVSYIILPSSVMAMY